VTTPSDALTPRIGRPATAALALVGVRTYAALTTWSRRDVLALHGVGPEALRILDEELTARGLAFATDR
jgi:hypothetical protein